VSRLLWAVVLLLPQAEDPAAAALYAAARDRVVRATSLRAEFSVTLERDRQEFGSFHGLLKAKGPGRWTLDLTLVRRDLGEEERRPLSAFSDGRRVRIVEGAPEGQEELRNAPESGLLMRRVCVDSSLPLIAFADPRLVDYSPERPMSVGSLRVGGREKVDGREADILDATLKVAGKGTEPQELALKVWLDRETKLPLRRVLSVNAMRWSEKIAVTLDPDLPDGDFQFQTRHRLARAQSAQLAESVRLFTRYTGRAPESLEELALRPADLEPDVFWPRRGFLLGTLPLDPWGRPYGLVARAGRSSIVCLGADGREGGKGDDEDVREELPPPTGSAVGAPTERLSNHLNARIDLQLLSAAVKAFQETYGELPGGEKPLREREPWMTVWCDGGWIPAEGELRDPWGDPYRVAGAEHHVRAQVPDAKAVMGVADLTEPERRRLEEIAQPRVRASERPAIAALLDRLGDDDFAVRERAQAELRGKGAGILSMIEARLKTETDGEIVHRMQVLRRGLPKAPPAWTAELGRLRFVVFAENLKPQNIQRNEFLASVALRRLWDAQAEFRSKDLDGNGVHDFWTGDVAGLVKGLAAVDAAPLRPLPEEASKQAQRNGYWFRALRKDGSVAPPEAYQLDTTGSGGPKSFNRNRFGAVCYPMEYAVTGVRTFIVNEARTVFWKDNQGDPVEEWPDAATLKREWTPIN
jgi:general secretion pathway protein G